MKFVLHGLRAATFVALGLTLWSFLVVSGALEAESEQAGTLFVLSAYGILGMPLIVYAFTLGVIADGWAGFLASAQGKVFVARLEEPLFDRQMASLVIGVPLASVVLAGAVAASHLAVTSKFARPGFQALGIAAVVSIGLVGLTLFVPLYLRVMTKVIAFLPTKGESRTTTTVLTLLAASLGVVVIVAYLYATGLNVWPLQTLRMMLFGLLGVPLAVYLMARTHIDRMVWNVGIPLAGATTILIAFLGAADWTSSSAVMRKATSQQSALVAFEAKVLQRFSDGDGDSYAATFGGADCDDTNDAIYPGARDIPGNGIDESCSGADAEVPSGAENPSRKLVSQAVDAGRGAAKRASEKLPDPPKNLLVLMIDTLRIDHMGFAGYERNTTPHLDQLAKESTVFAKAYATSPHTPRSIPAIFVGRYPSHTAWRGGQYNYPKVKPENTSFFEVLADNGHVNHGYSSHHYFQEKRGLGQGFESWDNKGFLTIAESNDDSAAPRTWAKVEPAIEEFAAAQKAGDKPFSMFVHLFEPHARWITHKEFPFPVGDEKSGKQKAAYDSEIAFTDSYIGKILQKLKDTGLYDKTVIVVVSDHGEGFNEHGFFFHGQTIYNEVVRVPLMIRVPGWPTREVDQPVSIADVGPTVLDLFGYARPEDFDGVSLMPLMLGQEVGPRPIFMELLPYTSWKEHHKAVVLGDLKYISVLSAGTQELYDLATDPLEKTNIIKERPEDAAKMEALLERFMNQ